MKNIWSVQAHKGFVRGVCVSPRGDYFLTCSTDQTVKKWPIQQHFSGKLSEDCGGSDQLPQYTWLSDQAFTSLDHHRRRNIFATGGARVQLWDEHRSAPMDTFEWDSATDTVTSVQFNPVEVEILASSGSDRSICLHDLRMATSIKKVILTMRTNHIAWNPIEAFNFTAANEDSNCYTFDMRRLESALNVHKDHVSAVLSIDYSPTGREFVTGSYDRTIRIFEYNKGHSREIYYTKRMQRVFSVLWTFDAKFVLSGSDETNIRVWKAKAAEKLGSVSPREQTALNYCERLRERYQHHPEIKRIRRHRHVPRSIKKAKELKTLMIQAQKRKEDNRRIHSKPGSIPHTQERKKNIVALKN
ncbi:DDB1- and CUL4-associated factor 13-like [Zophobas morio]|uniref:DDB1- and CUL4-associated factor 13-like n=1 Tax=Zophobas morio TaxID=2755281 RepID=UPI003083B0E1